MYNIIKYVELVIASSFGIGCYDHESSLTGSPVVADEHEENFSNTGGSTALPPKAHTTMLIDCS